jgi:hypothetical protein
MANKGGPYRDGRFSPNGYIVNKFGRNSSVGSSFVIVRPDNTDLPFPTSADTISIVSASLNDVDTTGSGARTIIVQGLDANWERQSVEYSMNGTTPEESTETWTRVFRAYVSGAGQYIGTNAGQITITHTTSGDILAVITAGDVVSQTQEAVFTVDANHYGFLLGYHVAVQANQKSANIRIMTREGADTSAAPYKAVRERSRVPGVSGVDYIEFTNGKYLPPKTDIWAEAQGSGTGSDPDVSVEFQVMLHPVTLRANP